MSSSSTEHKVPEARERSDKNRTGSARGNQELVSESGRTSIADQVVTKIVGMAAREVGGVHAMGGGTARAFGAVRDRIPGQSSQGSVSRGVAVEVGERQAACDIDLVIEYGAAIPDLAAAVRRNVIGAVERMTGLQVTEVNINIDDIHLPGDDADEEETPSESRVE